MVSFCTAHLCYLVARRQTEHILAGNWHHSLIRNTFQGLLSIITDGLDRADVCVNLHWVSAASVRKWPLYPWLTLEPISTEPGQVRELLTQYNLPPPGSSLNSAQANPDPECLSRWLSHCSSLMSLHLLLPGTQVSSCWSFHPSLAGSPLSHSRFPRVKQAMGTGRTGICTSSLLPGCDTSHHAHPTVPVRGQSHQI